VSSEVSVALLLVFGELGQLLVDELGEARIFCCQLICSTSHFGSLRLGLLHCCPGLSFGCRGALVGLVDFVPQCLLGLLCFVYICDICLGIFGQLLYLAL